ncbi:hypothetical protein ACRCUN_32050 [Mycobacterium sp. LTG2003]
MTDQQVAIPARPRLDADTLPLWCCAAGVLTGVLLVAAVQAETGGSHGAAGHTHADHFSHVLMIVGTTLIMMSPFAFPLLHTVARTTLWTEAALAISAAWAAFIGIWCVVAVGMHLAGEVVTVTMTPVGAVVVLTGVCVATQLSRGRALRLTACRRTRPMRPGRPVGGGLRWGADACYRCMRLCAVPMTLMALSPALTASALITGLLWWERFSVRGRDIRVPLAAGYLAVGVAMLAPIPV